MSRDPKKKIPVSAPQSGLNQAFAQLDLGPLAAGPGPAPGPADPQWKLGRVVLRRETAQRGGKTVIVVHDFATHLPASVIEKTARTLRQQCGCGGTVKGRTIEIQGDQAGRIRAVLEKEGFQVAGVS